MFRVILGTTTPDRLYDKPAYDEITDKKPINKCYNYTSNCVSLIFLQRGILKFDERIQPIKLPLYDCLDCRLNDTVLAYATRHENNGNILQYLEIEVRPIAECRGHFHKDLLQAQIICGVSKDQYGSQFGDLWYDNGVPLVKYGKVLMGMLSDANANKQSTCIYEGPSYIDDSKRCKQGGPFLFNKMVPDLVDWIDETIGYNSVTSNDDYSPDQDIPYQAFIDVYDVASKSLNDQTTPIRQCNGVAIDSPYWVLTTSQCVRNGITFRVRLGPLDHPAYDERTDIFLSETYPYDRHTENTLTLLKLKKKVQFVRQRFIPVLLPQAFQQMHGKSEFVGQDVVASRYDNSTDHRLQYIDMKVVNISECQTGLLLDKRLCARSENVNFDQLGTLCFDIGVSLVANDGTLIGMLSDANSSCIPGKPFSFIRIDRYVDWIHPLLSKHGHRIGDPLTPHDNQFPFQAFIDVYRASVYELSWDDWETPPTRQCNGVIISSTWVMTTKKCVGDDGATFRVRLGLPLNSPAYNAITTVKLHLSNNLYALQLDKNIVFSDDIKEVKLPNSTSAESFPAESYYNLTATYYGNPSDHYLQHLNMRVVNILECKDYVRVADDYFKSRFLCTRSDDENVNEDGVVDETLCSFEGVPLVANNGILIGMLNVCRPEGPFLFIRIDYISKVIS